LGKVNTHAMLRTPKEKLMVGRGKKCQKRNKLLYFRKWKDNPKNYFQKKKKNKGEGVLLTEEKMRQSTSQEQTIKVWPQE